MVVCSSLAVQTMTLNPLCACAPPPPPGDLLESEQSASMQLRKELSELERRVEALQGNNNSLEKKVCAGTLCHYCCRQLSVPLQALCYGNRCDSRLQRLLALSCPSTHQLIGFALPTLVPTLSPSHRLTLTPAPLTSFTRPPG
jgi:hypothetical protein